MKPRHPLYLYPLLIHPERVQHSLDLIRESSLVPKTPNLWQVNLGVIRMWHRVFFRFNSIGTSSGPSPRPNWRAGLLRWRPLRFPFLIRERAVAPLDFSGLASCRERVIRHLIGAHHDREQFVYDLELLSIHPGAMEELTARVRAVVEATDPRSEWLRDLTVFEGYHENLLHALVSESVQSPTCDDPDITLKAYLNWCARQPPTPTATVQALLGGRYTIAEGIA